MKTFLQFITESTATQQAASDWDCRVMVMVDGQIALQENL